MAAQDLCFLSAAELAPQIRKRAVSPVEVVEAHLGRIATPNDQLRAYLYVASDQALAASRAAEIDIAAGNYRGPLHGISVAYEDIYHVAGMPTTAASKVMAGYIAAEDCTVAARLRRAGAICLGKLNTHEFASGSMEVFGTARNPWNTALVPGGSSSGSGTALAVHLVTCATGSDTGGSVHNPASFCGVVGLKPTYGRISRAGIIPLSWNLDHAGPMARTVTDTAMLLQAIAGPDSGDASAATQPIPDYQATLQRDLQGIRIGVPRTFFFDDGDPDIITSVREAIQAMREMGAALREIEQAAGWYQRRPPIREAPTSTPSLSASADVNGVEAQWVLDMARLTGLTFVTESDAEPIAASIGPVKAMLAEARARLDARVEPPVRPAAVL